jgi:7,8-dihydroneopterin aldolase/epimerase/oxygenase
LVGLIFFIFEAINVSMKIGITNAHFFAFHGYFEEERFHGNHFKINMEVEVPDEVFENENLDSSVDYGELYLICKRQMMDKRHLLETVGFSILEETKLTWTNVVHAKIRIEKIGPQLGGLVGSSFIELEF